jgi:hypothetical protein
MKIIKYIILSLVFVCTTAGLAQAESISNIPSIMSAPVVLYDEANNVLTDGEYTVTITLSDLTGTTLYAEEQEVTVEKGVAYITIGQGYAVGSGFSSPAGGLSWSVFAYQSDVSVEIYVDGQANVQEITVLGSQPYSFISQRALTVADDSITSDKIKDRTITEDDLDEGLVDKILGASGSSGSSSTTSGTTMVDAENVSVSSSIGLKNASGGNVHDVLKGLDTSIDLLKATHLDQGLSNVEEDVVNINNTINNLDDTYATDAQLTSVTSTVSSNTTRIGQNELDIDELDDKVDNLDLDIDEEDVPVVIRPVAYGYMESSNQCENMTLVKGYNIDTIYPSHSSVRVGFENAITPKGTLIIMIDDVSNPSSQPDIDHKCIRGRGMYAMSSSSITNMYVISCSDSADCNSINERAVSFMIYLIPD